MKNTNYKSFKKGKGIVVNIPGDHHNGIQCIRPGIVLDSNSEYITAQLFSSRSNPDDLGCFIINNKIQYIRGIYLKNILLNHIKGYWWNKKTKKNIELDIKGPIMKAIEQYPYKATAITLDLKEYLSLREELELQKTKIKELEDENDKLKEKHEKLIKFLPNELEQEYEN